MAVPHEAPAFDDVLRRAREARAARDRAEQEWVEARDKLRAAAEAGTLPRELRSEVDGLLADDPHAHQHRRWRPSPS